MGRKRLDRTLPRPNPPKKRKKKRKKGDDSDSESDYSVDKNPANAALNKTVSCTFKQREKVDLNIILAQDEEDALKAKHFCWNTVYGGATSSINRKVCTVCGFEGKYKCSKCFDHKPSLVSYYCSLNCKKVHDDATCCKPRI